MFLLLMTVVMMNRMGRRGDENEKGRMVTEQKSNYGGMAERTRNRMEQVG